MNAWSWYWLGWLLSSFTFFIIPESFALASRKPENTLSAQIWRLEGAVTGQPIWQWTAVHFLLGGIIFVFLMWLMLHFVLRLFT